MKQKITVAQLNELSEKGHDKYYRWMYRDFAPVDAVKSGHQIAQDNRAVRTLNEDLISIGQMLEFLENKSGDYFQAILVNDDVDYGRFYTVVGKINYGANELVDALWEAVKQVLEA